MGKQLPHIEKGGAQVLLSLEKRLLIQYAKEVQKGQGWIRLTPCSVLLMWSFCLPFVQTDHYVTAWEVKENT